MTTWGFRTISGLIINAGKHTYKHTQTVNLPKETRLISNRILFPVVSVMLLSTPEIVVLTLWNCRSGRMAAWTK